MRDNISDAISKNRVAKAFSRAAKQYDAYSVLQQEIGKRVIGRLSLIKNSPQTILDLGQGSGAVTKILAKKFPKSHIVGVDLAFGMAKMAQSKKTLFRSPLWQMLQGDCENIPLKNNSVDLIFANCVFQWSPDLSATFRECKRVLKENGMIFFSTFGPDTLQELRNSFKTVSAHQHVNNFIDMHDVGDKLMHCQFSSPVMDMEYFTLTYASVRQLMNELKQLGASNQNAGRNKGLTPTVVMNKMIENYEQFRRTLDNKLPATFEVIYGHAFNPSSSLKQWEDERGTFYIPTLKKS